MSIETYPTQTEPRSFEFDRSATPFGAAIADMSELQRSANPWVIAAEAAEHRQRAPVGFIGELALDGATNATTTAGRAVGNIVLTLLHDGQSPIAEQTPSQYALAA